MIFPDQLYQGDTIGVIAPCSPVSIERANRCEEYLQSLGYQVLMGESTKLSLHGYLAGSDEIRAKDINTMFANKAVKAIICIRGGYGGNRLMRLLDYDLIRRNPKIFMGYSDITSFHLAFHKLCSMVTFHGPMVSSNMLEDFDEYTKSSFLEAVSIPSNIKFQNPTGVALASITGGHATGEIIGGCLSLISPAIGTFYQPDFHHKILFLEDIHEDLPRCDKMIEHLFHSGVMEQISGLILGDFTECNNNTDLDYTIIDYFKERFSNYSKPVMYQIQSGHCIPMATIPFGYCCHMDADKKTIEFYR